MKRALGFLGAMAILALFFSGFVGEAEAQKGDMKVIATAIVRPPTGPVINPGCQIRCWGP